MKRGSSWFVILRRITMKLIQREAKTCAYSVRMDERTHDAILALSAELGECRAVATVEFAKRGLEAYAKELGVDLSPSGIEQILREHGVVE
jgi:predicted deacylase